MYWYNDKLKIKTSKKDIPVWKIVKCSIDSLDKCYSLYNKFTYVKHIIEETSIGFEVDKCGGIVIGNKGFHSYSNKLKWEIDNINIIVFRKKTLFRPKKCITYAANKCDIRIAKFHIPKGYKYAENKKGEIISSAIVFDGFIE